MIRGDLLRAKTSQVSVQHQREVSSLGRIHERETLARTDVQRREQRFWKEISQATAAKAGDQGRQMVGNRGAPIERALEAHRLLKDAKAKHQGVSKELRDQVSKVMRSKYAVDTFLKIQQKHRVRSEFRQAERVGEQVDEVVSMPFMRRSIGRLKEVAAKSGEICGRFETLELEKCSPVMGFLQGSEAPPPCILQPPVPSKGGDLPVRVTDTLSLQSMRFDAHQATPTLTVKIEQRGAPLVCRVAAAPSGEMGVIVGTPRGDLSERIERNRVGLISKLSELGIRVSSVEVRRDSLMGGFKEGALRRGRRNQEEQDENTIA